MREASPRLRPYRFTMRFWCRQGKVTRSHKNLLALGIGSKPIWRHPFRGVTKGLEVRKQAYAARIADAEFLDQLGIAYATLGQILHALAMPVQFQLVESGGLGEQLGGRSELFGQVGNAVAEGEMARQFDKADQVAAAPTAVTKNRFFSRMT